MLKVEEAIQRADDMLRQSYMPRMRHEANYALWLSYLYGAGWSSVQMGGKQVYGSNGLSVLKSNMRELDQLIRVSIPKILPRVEKIQSKLRVPRLDFMVEPASGAANDHQAAQVASARLRLFCDGANTTKALNMANWWRVAFGSIVIRRHMTPRGPGVVVRDMSGQPLGDPNNPQTVRSFNYGWSIVPTFEIIRDPAARSQDFSEEDLIGHEKPRTLEWLDRNFPSLKYARPETQTTMGQLTQFQRFMASATGERFGYDFSQSEAKSVMVSEWWFQDPSAPDGTWPYHLMAYRVYDGQSEQQKLRPLQFGRSAYHGLPLTHYWYTPQLIGPWGMGVVERSIALQDTANMARTILFRAMYWHGTPKYVIEQNSLADPPERSLSPDPRIPIVVMKGATKMPQRLNGGPIDQNTLFFAQGNDAEMDQTLNMSPIQSGLSSKRGEAGKALELKLGQADTVLDAITGFDELADNQLLTGTLFDIIRSEPLRVMQHLLSNRFPANHIMALKAQDVGRTLIGVKVKPDSLRAKTPAEAREDYAADITVGLIDAATARMDRYQRFGVIADSNESAALDRQKSEIGMILAGQKVQAEWGHNHPAHIRVLDGETESPAWDSYSEQQKNDLRAHRAEHWGLQTATAQVMQQLNPQQQGGPQQQAIPAETGQEPYDINPAQGGETEPFPPNAPQDQFASQMPGELAAPEAGAQEADLAMAM